MNAKTNHFLQAFILLISQLVFFIGLAACEDLKSENLADKELNNVHLGDLDLFPNAEAGDSRFIPYIIKVRKYLKSLCNTKSSSLIEGFELKKKTFLFKGSRFIECRGSEQAPIIFVELNNSLKPHLIAFAWVEENGKPITLPDLTENHYEYTSFDDGEVFTYRQITSDFKTIILIDRPPAEWTSSLSIWK